MKDEIKELKNFLERKIKGCDNLGGMEKEKWAFIQTLKFINSEALDKKPNVIDNEVEEKKCEHPYDKIKIDFDNWGVWCHKCNSAL